MAYDQHTADVERDLERIQDHNEYLVDMIGEMKACLRDLMDAADRDRQGAPLPYEEWRIRYDWARRLSTGDATEPNEEGPDEVPTAA